MKIETVTVDSDVQAGGNVLAAGEYLVAMPSDYDATEVTGEAILMDGMLVIVDPDAAFVLAEGEDAEEWSRHGTEAEAEAEARGQGFGRWSIWRSVDYDTQQSSVGPVRASAPA